MTLKYAQTFQGVSTTVATARLQLASRSDGTIPDNGADLAVRAGRFPGTVAIYPNSSTGTTDNTNGYRTPIIAISGTLIRGSFDVYPDTGADVEIKHLISIGNTAVYRSAASGDVLVNNASTFFGIVRRTDGKLAVRAGNVELAVSTATVPLTSFTRIEFEADIKIAGNIKVFIAGNPTPEINYSGNITNGITSLADMRVQFGAAPLYIGHLFVWDDASTGDGFSGYLGDFEAVPLVINGTGSSSDSTVVGAANRHSAVDDSFRNGLTDYVFATANGQKDLYTKAAVGRTGVVIGLLLQPSAMLGGTGHGKIKAEVKSAAATASSAASAPLSTSSDNFGPISLTHSFGTDPNTGVAWTVANIDSAEIGWSAVI